VTAAPAEQAAGAPTGTKREVLIVLPGLLLAIILAMLDQLIVSTALPHIVGTLHGLNHLSWVVTAYVLTSCITTLVYGKLGDMYGRKRLLMIAIVIFLIGSALSGLAASMDQLIAFRALQGAGAGGLMVGAIAALGDMVSPRERGQYMGYMMAAMMVAMVAGPLVGGYITDSLSWRWIFYINMPVGGAALVYLAATMHMPRRKIGHKIDYLGGVLAAVSATALVLLTTWGGSEYRWGSPQIIGLGVLAVAAGVAFCLVELRAAEPLLPLHVFRNLNFTLSSAMSFMVGLMMFGALTFLPIYQQTVQHLSATGSGLMLIPLMLGSMVTTILAGQVTSRTGKYKMFPIIGSLIMAVGLLLLTRLGVGTSLLLSGVFFAVLGIGMGFLMNMTTIIVQNSVHPRDMGVASSSRTFFQQIGGSIGVSIFGVIFARRLAEDLAARLPGVHLAAAGGQLNPIQVNSLPTAIKHAAYFSISHAEQGVFWWAVPSALAVFVLAWFVREVPLRGRAEPSTEQATPELVV
jgi:EmrB/QacA subfamily drug resistance transporter